jgi:hypothetical protein
MITAHCGGLPPLYAGKTGNFVLASEFHVDDVRLYDSAADARRDSVKLSPPAGYKTDVDVVLPMMGFGL